MRALNRKLFRDLWHLRGQAMAIAMIVASGVAVLVMSLSAMQAMTDSADAYYERYRFADVFASTKRSPTRLLNDIRELPGVQSAAARIHKIAMLDVAGFVEPVIGSMISLPENTRPHVNQLVLRAGRYPDSKRLNEVMINEPFAQAHELSLGSEFSALLNGRKRSLTVVGVVLSPEFIYAIGPGALMPDAARYGIVWMGEAALGAAYDLEHAFNDLAVTVWPGADIPALTELVDQKLKRYGGIGAYGREDQISNWFVTNEISQLKSLAGILPPIFLIVAAFLTNMVLVRLVFLERAEIGLLKAFGYRRSAVAWHYVKFVILVSATGVVIGWIFGLWFGRYVTGNYAKLFRFPELVYNPDYSVFVTSAVVSIGAALVGALSAARQAAKLAPAEAMRPSAPPTFRRRIQNSSRLLRMFDQPTRMIIRQILRSPMRSSLTCLGVAASVALLILSLQWFDALDHLVHDFFDHQMRQDVTIVMVEPEPLEIVEDIARLPGMLAVEPQRSVITRLHAGPRERREAILGLTATGALEQLHDTNGHPVPIPADGLLLSKAMADILQVEVGQTVIVEVLEGRQPRVNIPVAAIFETYIGTPVYMELNALNRLLKEPKRANLFAALMDERQAITLFEEVKQLPKVAGVLLKHAAVDLFNDTVAENMMFIIWIYIAFGVTVAVGVIYNNMRISLSERGRELATLRVVGFRNSEIAYMLFGEAALLALPGLALGCLFGWLLATAMAQDFNTELFRIPVAIEPATYGYSIVIALAAMVLSALLVEHRLLKLDLISVLKTRE